MLFIPTFMKPGQIVSVVAVSKFKQGTDGPAQAAEFLKVKTRNESRYFSCLHTNCRDSTDISRCHVAGSVFLNILVSVSYVSTKISTREREREKRVERKREK
jgi:hypothetical protein